MMLTLDAHCDAPSQMSRLRDYGRDNDFAQVDFPKMRQGEVYASCFAAFVPASLQGADATAHAVNLLELTRIQVEQNASTVALAHTPDEVRSNYSAGRISIIRAIENASALNGSLELLDEFRQRGVCYITLTHSADNDVCDSCTGQGKWKGLSPFGRSLVKEMNRRGVLVDLAHSADSTVSEVLELSESPVAYTHGGCRALASHPRNLPDTLIRGIAESGGIVCISIYPRFLDDGFEKILAASGLEDKMYLDGEFRKDPGNPAKAAAWKELQLELMALERPGISRVADHIEHAVGIAGIDHVGLGTDYDGIEVMASGLENISKFPALFEELGSRGFSAGDIAKIAGENFLRVLERVQNTA